MPERSEALEHRCYAKFKLGSLDASDGFDGAAHYGRQSAVGLSLREELRHFRLEGRKGLSRALPIWDGVGARMSTISKRRLVTSWRVRWTIASHVLNELVNIRQCQVEYLSLLRFDGRVGD